MQDNNSKVWWDDITGPSTLVKTIVSNLQNSKSILLFVPEDLPWRRQMRCSVEVLLRENDPDCLISYIDCKTDCPDITDIPGYILDTYADPYVKTGYRTTSGISIYTYISKCEVLKNRILWVKGMNKKQTAEWYSFCMKYQAATRHNGLLVVEAYAEFPTKKELPYIKQLYYLNYISFYDALLFNNMIASKTTYTTEWKKYAAAVSSKLCNCDVELSESLLMETDFSKVSPVEALEITAKNAQYDRRREAENLDESHPFSLLRRSEKEKMNRRVWEAQLQSLFPLIEYERITFIDNYFDEIKEALVVPFREIKKSEISQIAPSGENAMNPYDVEIGTLYFMNCVRRADDETLYLLFLPDEDDRKRLSLLHDIRNSLAHLDVCAVETVDQLLSNYPYEW